jgi:hypothetical protein
MQIFLLHRAKKIIRQLRGFYKANQANFDASAFAKKIP